LFRRSAQGLKTVARRGNRVGRRCFSVSHYELISCEDAI
jgi:hypothetical protein